MESRWNEPPKPELEQLAYASRLIGTEPDLALHGGGNSSLKTIETDHLGRRLHLMFIKPSGADMASLEADDFTSVRLEDLEPLVDCAPLPDDELGRYLRRAQLDPDRRQPSIETLLHAFLPDRWVLHSHADALLAVCNRPDGAQRIADALGDDVAVVPYRRPGAQLAQEVAEARRDNPEIKGVVLMKHGLVTFGGDAKEAYDRHIDLVSRCERAAPLEPLGEAPPSDLARAAELAPRVRGAIGPGRVLLFDDDAEVRAFLASDALMEAAQRGPATCDHIIRAGRVPCVLLDIEDIGLYRQAYEAYAKSGDRGGLPMNDSAPRVVLAPGVGMWTAGETIERAAIARDIYRHTMRMIRRGGGAWDPIGKEDAFRAEYWPIQARKLAGEEGELAGRVAWISGAAGGIGLAIAQRFLREGAHVVLTDLDPIELRGPRVLALDCDITDEDQVEASFERACLAFGGVDIVVSNAGIARPAPVEQLDLAEWEKSFAVNARGHFLVARAALRVLRSQALGGSIVFNASKNVLAPGKGFAAYSASKAAQAQLAKVLALEAAPIGVRVNVLHPDAVFAGTRLWTPEMRAERARSHNVPVEKLEEFYARRNLLKRPVRPIDVAEAALFFASERSSRTTGACLTVDGGVKEAFPR
ncbi:MAG: bifunctional aldolase/short-chain dehydrogenase [Planctomycetota bacterium]